MREQLEHYLAMRDLAAAHGERWGVIGTEELIRRHEQELAWLARLADLAAQPDPELKPEPRPDRKAGTKPWPEPGAAP